MNKISKLLTIATAAGVVSLAGGGQALAAQHEPTSDVQWMERMQSHWRQVINETDPQKRRELLRDHEQIMAQAVGSDEAGSATGADNGAGHMGMNGSHVNMMNTVDMHQHMIDMMR